MWLFFQFPFTMIMIIDRWTNLKKKDSATLLILIFESFVIIVKIYKQKHTKNVFFHNFLFKNFVAFYILYTEFTVKNQWLFQYKQYGGFWYQTFFVCLFGCLDDATSDVFQRVRDSLEKKWYTYLVFVEKNLVGIKECKQVQFSS